MHEENRFALYRPAIINHIYRFTDSCIAFNLLIEIKSIICIKEIEECIKKITFFVCTVALFTPFIFILMQKQLYFAGFTS